MYGEDPRTGEEIDVASGLRDPFQRPSLLRRFAWLWSCAPLTTFWSTSDSGGGWQCWQRGWLRAPRGQLGARSPVN